MAIKVNTGKRGNLPERLIVVGEKGVGKSAFGAECAISEIGSAGEASKDVIFIPSEDGCSNIKGLSYFDVQTTLSGTIKCIEELLNETHTYKKVVLDTLDSLYRLCVTGITRVHFDNKPTLFNAYGQGDKIVVSELYKLLSLLDRLRLEKNMAIVVLAHAGTVNKKNPDGDDYIKNSADVSKNVWALFHGWADRVGYAGYEFKIKGGNDAEGKKGKVIQRDNNRYIWFQGSASVDAKTRVGYELKQTKLNFTFEDYKGAM